MRPLNFSRAAFKLLLMTGDLPSESSFREMVEGCLDSLWSLELLLLIFNQPARIWTTSELVKELRSSDLAVAQSVQCLGDAGLLIRENDGTVRYAPASADLDVFVAKLDNEYRTRPTQIRVMIVGRSNAKLTAFSDAFLLRRPPQ
jgi:hypothetical protein